MTDPTDQQQPSQEEIAARAYQIYLWRTEADELSDWYEAEEELQKGNNP